MNHTERADVPTPADGSLVSRATDLLSALGSDPEAVLETLMPVLLSPPLRAMALAHWLRDRLPAGEAIDLDVPSPHRLRLLGAGGELIEVRLPAAVRAFLTGR